MAQELAPDLSIDITRDACPMTFVRTRLALDRLAPGQVLQVRLTGEEPQRNVPLTATAQGHKVLGQSTDAAGIVTLLLRKGRQAGPEAPSLGSARGPPSETSA